MTGHPYGGPGIPEDPMDNPQWRRFVLGCVVVALLVLAAGVAAVAWGRT